MSILDRIMEDKRVEVEARRGARPLAELEAEVVGRPPTRPFAGALGRPGGAFSIIAEVKKASPSAGVIAKDFDPELQAMLGYAMGYYALGYFTPPLPPGKGPEVVPPDFLFNGKVASWGDEMYEKVSARAQDGAV